MLLVISLTPRRFAAALLAVLCLTLLPLLIALAAVLDDPVRNAIAARVRELKAGGPLAIEGEPLASRIVLPALYEKHDYAPLWSNPRSIDQLLGAIRTSDQEGLLPADYHLAALQALSQRLTDAGDAAEPELAADFDLLLTDAVVRLGYHLGYGKVDPRALNPDWNMRRQLAQLDAVASLDAVIRSGHVDAWLDALRPPLPLYARLKSALQEYRRIEAQGGWQSVAAGPSLKPGVSDPRVPALRRRLAAGGDLPADNADSPEFDASVETAVRRFQQHHGMSVDGVAGKETLAAMNVSVGRRIDQIRANLERARWVLHDLPDEFALVDIAGFKVRYYRDGRVIWETRAVVGRPVRKTPVFKSLITYLVVNPAWTVPPTILRRDILPAVIRDPNYLREKHMRVIDYHGNPVDLAGIDWSSYSSSDFPYLIRQDPGPENALGRIKFMFPNKHMATCTTRRARNCSLARNAPSVPAASASRTPTGSRNCCSMMIPTGTGNASSRRWTTSRPGPSA